MLLSFPVALFVLILCIIFIIAGTKKGSKYIDKKPKVIKSVTSEKSIDIVFKNLIKFGKNGSYKVDTMDEDKKVIVFSENASFMHMGFFYPVYLTSENNVTKIEVGIQGKLREFKSVVQKNHEIFFTNIKVALLDTE